MQVLILVFVYQIRLSLQKNNLSFLSKISPMKYIIFLLISILCLSASCHKEYLPDYYFQCKVDGKKYVPDNCANCMTATILGDSLLILGGNRYVEAIAIDALAIPLMERIYPLIEKRQLLKGTAYYDNTIGNPSDIYRTDTLRIGELIITNLDKTKKIIAGTFYFEAYNVVQNKTIKITDGKFRLKYTTN